MHHGIAQQAPAVAGATHKAIEAWAAKPAKLIPYLAPNRLIWRLADVLAMHKQQQDWTELVVNTRDFIGQWISLGPHEATKTVFYADDRIFFVYNRVHFGSRLKVKIHLLRLKHSSCRCLSALPTACRR